MDESSKIDRFIDIMIMLGISGFISWVIGRFEVFPIYHSLEFYGYSLSIDIVKMICVVFYMLMVVYHSEHFSLINIMIVSLSPYALFVYLKACSTYMIVRYMMLVVALLFIALYSMLAIRYNKKIKIKVLLHKLIIITVMFMYITTAIDIFIPELTLDDEITQSYQLSDYSEVLMNFKEESWNKMSTKEKKDIISDIADIEMVYLTGKKDDDLSVVIKEFQRDSLSGYYTYYNSEITINSSLLDDRVNTLSVLLHECYHCYQYVLIEEFDRNIYSNVKMIRDIKQWKYEQQNYITATMDYDAYYNQELEKSAREYSNERIQLYLNYI